MKGTISDIIPFSLHDGPGIRTTVFLKGCPLRCAWCHNPETHRTETQCLYTVLSCVHCGRCAKACPEGLRAADGGWKENNQNCTGCGACVAVCPVRANVLRGSDMTPEEILKITEKDKAFYKDRGGVTFSGGEPLMQGEFLLEAVKCHKAAGISVALETSGFGDSAVLESLVPYVDLFLYDWKVTDPELHKTLTGVDNRLIKENLKRLNDAGADIILRCPIIPGCNDTKEHLDGIGALTRQFQRIRQVDLLPYHALGNEKRTKMGLEADGFRAPEEDCKQQWLEYLQSLCSVPVKL